MLKRRKPIARSSKRIPRSPLKRSQKPLKRSPVKKIGKRGKADKKNVRELKAIFERMNITFCEICGTRDFLSFAHSKKRKDIHNEFDMKHVALLCIADHEKFERLPPPEMFREISKIIEKRESNQRWEFIERCAEEVGKWPDSRKAEVYPDRYWASC